MYESDETNKSKPKTEDNYYAGYYFSNNPYSSEEQLPGRRTDEELRKLISSRLKNIPRVDTSKVAVNVVDQVVSLTGSVKTFEDKRRVGEEAWKIEGVVKVLNELHVMEPSTAGPARRD
jgi:osmotically-inducible protein OsmY